GFHGVEAIALIDLADRLDHLPDGSDFAGAAVFKAARQASGDQLGLFGHLATLESGRFDYGRTQGERQEPAPTSMGPALAYRVLSDNRRAGEKAAGGGPRPPCTINVGSAA